MNKEPDIRETTFALDNEGNYLFDTGAGAGLSRTYRDLLEISNNTKVDLEWKFKKWGNTDAKIIGGLAHLYKDRDFSIVMYNLRNQGLDLEFTGNPDQIFTEDNLYSASTNEGFWMDGQKNPSDRFQSNINITAGYIMNELPVSNKLSLVYGLRVEHAQMRYTGERQVIQTQNDVYDNQKVLNELDFLPSLNATYKIKDNMNLRFAGSKTLVRPSFKEKSLAQILDPISGVTFIGNVDDLEQTDIYNVDLRWEYFFNTGEMISFTTFYKHFNNPIELVAFQGESPNNITPRNADNARVIGLEFELKKKLTFISPALENLSLGTNVTYVNSKVKMTSGEYEDRLLELRTGETIDDTRTMQGQSPYIINAYLNYNDAEKGIEGNISYNVQGESLQVVGIRRNADVFTQSFHGLNMKLAKRLGKEQKWKVSVSAKNILNQKRLSVYKSYNAEDQVYRLIKPGVGFSLGVGYTM
jgi:TonB-dependent receptor